MTSQRRGAQRALRFDSPAMAKVYALSVKLILILDFRRWVT